MQSKCSSDSKEEKPEEEEEYAIFINHDFSPIPKELNANGFKLHSWLSFEVSSTTQTNNMHTQTIRNKLYITIYNKIKIKTGSWSCGRETDKSPCLHST